MNDFFLYIAYLIFALVPVFAWLFFYFKKDAHPEPKKMILKIFVLGMVGACLVAVFEIAVLSFFSGTSLLFAIFESFLLISLIEESAKYAVVRIFIYNSPVFDEPLDIMLYMVVSALGFAASENIILFFSEGQLYSVGAAAMFSLLRFVGAVFLHTLASGTLGFFIALSFCSGKYKKAIFFSGFFIAVVLHGFYDVAIAQFTGFWEFAIPIAIIVVSAIFTTYGFVRLRKMKGVCKISA